MNTQQSSQWPLHKWADYIRGRQSGEPGTSKVYNIISLEISETALAKQVRPPSLVSDIDWVENYWPFPEGKEEAMRIANAAGNGHEPKGKTKNDWPKVQLYCLVSSHYTADLTLRWGPRTRGQTGMSTSRPAQFTTTCTQGQR